MQVGQILHSEEFRTESASLIKHFSGDGEGSLQQLRLQVLINLVESSDIWGAITDDEVCLASLECLEYIVNCFLCCDVALEYIDAVNCGHLLQINTHNTIIFGHLWTLAFLVVLVQTIRQNLTPGTRSSAQVDCSLDSAEYVEFFVYLK